MVKTNRFAELQKLRKERHENEVEVESQPTTPQVKVEKTAKTPPASKPSQPSPEKVKRRGRPPGRRSDPNYTQISAYVPLELLQDVQDELSSERRELGTRTPRPVSQLVEDLLEGWLQSRKKK
ncbi:MAG: hypothetical protein AAFY72_03915 [Cyanobacteria bacterium J06649_4]